MHKELRTTSRFEPPSSTIGLQIRPVWTKSRRFVFEVDRSCRLALYKLVVPTRLDRKPSSESVTVKGSDDQYRTVQMRLLPSCRLLSYTRALPPRLGRRDVSTKLERCLDDHVSSCDSFRVANRINSFCVRVCMWGGSRVLLSPRNVWAPPLSSLSKQSQSVKDN